MAPEGKRAWWCLARGTESVNVDEKESKRCRRDVVAGSSWAVVSSYKLFGNILPSSSSLMIKFAKQSVFPFSLVFSSPLLPFNDP